MFSRLIETSYNQFDKIHTRRLRDYYRGKVIDGVIDVGAHKGEFIRLVVEPTVPVYAFEPQTSVHTALEANTAAHNVQEIVKKAVGAEVGEIELFVNSLSSTSSTLKPNENAFWTRLKRALLGGRLVEDVLTVEVTTLDSELLSQTAGMNKGLLKIDVEGNEGAVIAGARELLASGRVKYVQIESASFNIYQDAAFDPQELLEEMGFYRAKRFLFPLLNFSDIVFVRGES